MANPYQNGQTPAYDAPYTNTYHSISGVDIKAVLGGVTFGNLQAISYSITREKAPVYTMGSPSPRGFSRGKRGIAGSLVFIMFDSHVLLETFRALSQINRKYQFVSDLDESRPEVYTESVVNTSQGAQTKQQLNNFEGGLTLNAGNYQLSSGWEYTTPWYSDQVPPFNISLTGVNEQGYASSMAILGVEILNEGYGVSIDDIVSEQQMTFVAREVAPWTRIKGADFTPASINSPARNTPVKRR